MEGRPVTLSSTTPTLLLNNPNIPGMNRYDQALGTDNPLSKPATLVRASLGFLRAPIEDGAPSARVG